MVSFCSAPVPFPNLFFVFSVLAVLVASCYFLSQYSLVLKDWIAGIASTNGGSQFWLLVVLVFVLAFGLSFLWLFVLRHDPVRMMWSMLILAIVAQAVVMGLMFWLRT